jgi:hypothetical protein
MAMLESLGHVGCLPVLHKWESLLSVQRWLVINCLQTSRLEVALALKRF